MNDNRFYSYLHKQIPVMIWLSLFPGLGYIAYGQVDGFTSLKVFDFNMPS